MENFYAETQTRSKYLYFLFLNVNCSRPTGARVMIILSLQASIFQEVESINLISRDPKGMQRCSGRHFEGFSLFFERKMVPNAWSYP